MTPISIVVGYDLSRESDLAIDWATEHARRVGGRLSVLHIRTPMPGQVFSPDGAFGWQLWTTVSDDDPAPALPGVERAKAVLGEDAVSVEVSTGSAPGRLVEASQTADLVVVGSHGHGVLMTTLVGSTAYAVAAHAQCPVAVIRAPRDAAAAAFPGPDRPVVVGLEQTEDLTPILDAATPFAVRREAALRLVRVTPAPPVAGYAPLGEVTTQVDMDVVEADRELLRRATEQIRAKHPDMQVETSHEEGGVAQVLAAHARTAGLVVVGSRGLGGFAGLLLGSVSRALIHHAECPVLIVH